MNIDTQQIDDRERRIAELERRLAQVERDRDALVHSDQFSLTPNAIDAGVSELAEYNEAVDPPAEVVVRIFRAVLSGLGR